MKRLAVLLLGCISLFSRTFAMDESDLTKSSAVSAEWLSLVDKGDYEKSWATVSPRFQMTMPKKEWKRLVDDMRKSLGNLKERHILEQIPKQDPQGLPRGDYMVLLYGTAFEKNNVKELVTMAKGYDGRWRVFTYLMKPAEEETKAK